MPLKNERLELTASGYTSEGDGVCKAEGFVIFVPGMILGETALVQLLKVKKNYAYGKIVKLLVTSPERKPSDCDSYPKCGGCRLRHLSYDEELRFKKTLVEDAVERIGGMKLKIFDVTRSPAVLHYRNKAQLPVRLENGKPVTGFYASRSHRFISCQNCLIQDQRMTAAVRALECYMKETGVTAYDEKTHTGLIRHLYLRFGTEKMMICIVTNGNELPHPRILCENMLEACGTSITVVQNINTERTNVVLGETIIPLFGDGTIIDRLCGLKFQISPHSFFQINHAQTEQLYQKVLELSGVTKQDTVLDLYCGIGTMTLLFAQKAKQVWGIEIVAQAVENARENAKRNGIANASFLCGDAKKAVAHFRNHPIDIVVIDPPRAGCSQELLSAILAISPKRIVYVSCNPATLSRDLKTLSGKGYSAAEVYPYDMFPGTAHVECVVLMEKV